MKDQPIDPTIEIDQPADEPELTNQQSETEGHEKTGASTETEQANQLKEQLLRIQADMQNLQRRSEKEIANAHKYGLEKFALALLPVADSLEKALEHMNTESMDSTVKTLYDGVEMTATLLTTTLSKFNIEEIAPIGEPFDPNYHEAMALVDQPDAEPNTVVAVLQKGYSLNGRSIRPAMVTVSKTK